MSDITFHNCPVPQDFRAALYPKDAKELRSYVAELPRELRRDGRQRPREYIKVFTYVRRIHGRNIWALLVGHALTMEGAKGSRQPDDDECQAAKAMLRHVRRWEENSQAGPTMRAFHGWA